MTIAVAQAEVVDAARLAGIRLTEAYDDPERRASLLDRVESDPFRLSGSLATFYVVGEALAATTTPVSLFGLGSWPSAQTYPLRLAPTLGSGQHFVYSGWSGVRGEAFTGINDDVVLIGYGKTEASIKLGPPAVALGSSRPLLELVEEMFEAVPSSGSAATSKAFTAFTELRKWLRLTAREAADLIGVKRTTPNAWQREGREPRPASARRLYQLHAVVSALVRKLGENEAIRWLETGEPSPRERLLRGEIGPVASDAESVVIGPQGAARPRPGSLIDEPEGVTVRLKPRVQRRGTRQPPS
jgi:hypothetical protein